MADSRVPLVAELPGLCERGERAQVVGLVLAHQLTLHLAGRADQAGGPPEAGRTAPRLREQLGGALAHRLVTGQQDGGLALARHWGAQGRVRDEWCLRGAATPYSYHQRTGVTLVTVPHVGMLVLVLL